MRTSSSDLAVDSAGEAHHSRVAGWRARSARPARRSPSPPAPRPAASRSSSTRARRPSRPTPRACGRAARPAAPKARAVWPARGAKGPPLAPRERILVRAIGDLPATAFAGKIIVDANNYYPAGPAGTSWRDTWQRPTWPPRRRWTSHPAARLRGRGPRRPRQRVARRPGTPVYGTDQRRAQGRAALALRPVPLRQERVRSQGGGGRRPGWPRIAARSGRSCSWLWPPAATASPSSTWHGDAGPDRCLSGRAAAGPQEGDVRGAAGAAALRPTGYRWCMERSRCAAGSRHREEARC